jgi:hypothetical protein
VSVGNAQIEGGLFVQSDTLVRLARAEQLHWSGIAGQTLLFPAPAQDQSALACQTILCVYAIKGREVSLVSYFTTDEEGAFFLRLPPGSYAIMPLLPRRSLSLWSSPVIFKVSARKITPVRVEVFERGDS